MKIKFGFGLLVSGLLMTLVLRQTNFAALLDSLRAADLLLLSLAVFPLLLTQLVRAWRWKFLMEPIKVVPVVHLLPATVIGAMVDMVLPARGGDVVRAWIVGSKEQVSKVATLTTVVIEKIWDMVIIVLVAIPTLLLITPPSAMSTQLSSLRAVVVILGLICVVVMMAGFMLASDSSRWKPHIGKFLLMLPRRWRDVVKRRFEDFSAGMQSFSSARRNFCVLSLSVLLWLVFASSNYLILTAFNVDVPVYAAVILLVFQVLGVTLPSSPGFIGTYHAAVVAGFALLGVKGEQALSVAIAMHAAFFFPFMLAGFVFLWKENLSIRSVSRAVEPVADGAP